jgi:hypothetical protein
VVDCHVVDTTNHSLQTFRVEVRWRLEVQEVGGEWLVGGDGLEVGLTGVT